MFVERTNYFAKPGKIDRVLEIRRAACAVRVALGLPAGVVFVKQGLESDGPDVSWECTFPSLESWQRDIATRAASVDFESVRQQMGEIVDNFERHLNEVDGDAYNRVACAGDVSLVGHPIVPRQVEFQSGDETLAGYLYLPPGEGPFPCVITNHGSMINQGTTDLCRPGTASLLMSWGYASFLPHRHGYGESTGMPWDTEVSAEFGTDEYDRQLVARLESESDDVVVAAKYVAGQPEIDTDRIAVMGSSFGGTVTLWASTKSERFACAVEFAGAAINWEHTPELREAMMEATRHIKCPIYFLQAENDYSVEPTRVLGAMSAEAQHPIQSKVFPALGLSNDEGHFFERSGSLIWGPEIRTFLARWL
jgi:dienelactone hydrolase